MAKSKISISDAIKLLNEGGLNADYHIELTESDTVDATTAIKLGKLGHVIPEDRLHYPSDEDIIVEDDDFFDGSWQPIDSDIEDYKGQIQIKLQVDTKVQTWLSSTDIDLDALVSELLTTAYKLSRITGK